MGRRGWPAIEVPQGWFNVIRGRQPDGSVSGRSTGQTSANLCSRTMASGTFKGELRGRDGEREETSLRSRSSHCCKDCEWHGREFSRGDDSQWVLAKRNAQEAPIAVQVNGAQEFVDRALKAFGCAQQVAQRVGDRIGRGTGQVATNEETSGGRGKVPASAGASGVGLRNPQASANRPVRFCRSRHERPCQCRETSSWGDGQHPCRRTKSPGVDAKFGDARRSGLKQCGGNCFVGVRDCARSRSGVRNPCVRIPANVFQKPSGGVRGIVAGVILRRLVVTP